MSLSKRTLKILRLLARSVRRRFTHRHYRPWPFYVWCKKEACRSYTLITVVQDTEDRLDEFFKSLVRQSIDFKKYIRIVIIDDGSTARSGAMLEKWRGRYPDQVTIIRSSRRGVSAARNMALTSVVTHWVGFVDAGGFLSPDYIEKVDVCLRTNESPDPAVVFCRRKFCCEASGRFSDDDSLGFLFKTGNTPQPLTDLSFVPSAVSGAFFPLSAFKRPGVAFDEAGNSATVDVDFFLRYLDRAIGQTAAFVAGARHYVRYKTLNGPPEPSEDFRNGYNDALRKIGDLVHSCKAKKSAIPIYAQNILLGELVPRLKNLMERRFDATLSTLSSVAEFWRCCEELFSFIDATSINSFFQVRPDLGEACRIGVLGAFKGMKVGSAMVAIDRYDPVREMIRFRYLAGFELPEEEAAMFDGQAVSLRWPKTVARRIGDRDFCYERFFWVRLPRHWETLTLSIGGHQVNLICGRHEASTFQPSDLAGLLAAERPVGESWLLMDSDLRADDNAEHLYRYIKDKHPERKIFFALRKKSPDWRRLSAEGFNLLDFGSRCFYKESKGAGKIISSHADRYVFSSKKNFLRGKHFVFLQHGVIKDDLSGWINTLPVDLMLTSTQKEYDSIVGDGSPYVLSSREVVLTGLPRHDSLARPRAARGSDHRKILIMPTWRHYLVGSKKRNGQGFLPRDDFFTSRYARSWLGLLTSEKLRELAVRYTFKVRFQPHPNMRTYFEGWAPPGEHIEISLSDGGDIQDAFKKSLLLITDYSSVAFDMAFLEKMVLYYQFDEQEMFSGAHTYTPGYFNYRRDGFGPVAETDQDLLTSLEELLRHGTEPIEPYRARIQTTFPFRDGRACKRAYDAITALDDPLLGEDAAPAHTIPVARF